MDSIGTEIKRYIMKAQINYYEQKLNYELDSWDLADLNIRGEKVAIIDTRSADAYKREHIPGAINIPHRTINAESTSFLHKKVLCVTYCNGIGCNASTKGALNLIRLGFRVKELAGGLDWWKRDGHETGGTKERETVFSCNC
jgi:rhodanese-related sulfurtransferase